MEIPLYILVIHNSGKHAAITDLSMKQSSFPLNAMIDWHLTAIVGIKQVLDGIRLLASYHDEYSTRSSWERIRSGHAQRVITSLRIGCTVYLTGNDASNRLSAEWH